MSHPFHAYVASQLEEALREEHVVVFYDPYSEYEAFVAELESSAAPGEPLPTVTVGSTTTSLARHAGSYFALRAAVEPLVAADVPSALLVYVPGEQRDRGGSVLTELEKAGGVYGDAASHRLRSLARRRLREQFTDGDIDELLAPESISYQDVVRFLEQRKGSEASLLKVVLGDKPSEELIAYWLAADEHDDGIASKQATPELFRLIESRLGLKLEQATGLSKARHITLRYVLVSEFRSDLECDPPDATATVPTPSTADHLKRACDVARRLRADHPERYMDLANDVESSMGLSRIELDASKLGRIDTFRFEERALLSLAARLIVEGEFAQALGIAAGRRSSFWVDQDVARLAQWEACRLMAVLGDAVAAVTPELKKQKVDSAAWVQAYCSEGGWARIDTAQRRLEAFVAKMDDEPEAEQAHRVVRRAHEELLKQMAEGFAAVFTGSGWTVPNALHQTRVYPEVVEKMGGPTAYFLVDAMRYEMGVELAHKLDTARDLVIRPAVAALPSITPVGMAALLPGAAASFSVLEHKGGLASRIEDSVMPGINERLRFLKAKVPGVVDLELDAVLSTQSRKLKPRVADAPLVLVRSQEIDALGENVQELTARAAMDSVIDNVARAIRKLAKAGIEQFVITADHGHQFSIRKGDDMKTDKPGGETIDEHRRCWVGRGGSTPPGTVRVSGSELGYDTDLDFVFPTGLGVIKTGGGLTFHHGSISLQELIVPVLSLRIPAFDADMPAAEAAQLLAVPDRITNRTFSLKIKIDQGLFSEEYISIRIVLISDGKQVGVLGMAVGEGATFKSDTGLLEIRPGTVADIGMMLTHTEAPAVKVVVLDPATDNVLVQTDEIPVKLGI